MFSGCVNNSQQGWLLMFSIEGIYLQHYATTQSGFAEAQLIK